jgi:peptide deformylase
VTQEFHGMTARIIQHELDHLDGKLIFDYLDSEHKDWILKSLGL